MNDVVAIDDAPLPWGKFPELSEGRILPTALALQELLESTRILVADPNHLLGFTEFVRGPLRVTVHSDFFRHDLA